MTPFDVQILGWLAAALTLATFVCRDMRRLRLLAMAANAAFIGYGAAAQLLPVLMLHLALMPVNLWRLAQTFRPAPARVAAPSPSACTAAILARRRRPRSWRAAPVTPPTPPTPLRGRAAVSEPRSCDLGGLASSSTRTDAPTASPIAGARCTARHTWRTTDAAGAAAAVTGTWIACPAPAGRR
jgi:hypothetical protein